jgi:N-acetylglucosamine-6-sulfatase
MVRINIIAEVRSCLEAGERDPRERCRGTHDITFGLPPASRATARRRVRATIISVVLMPMVLMTLRSPGPASAATRPNIVLFLTDDFDMSLVTYVDPGTGKSAMPNLQALLAAKGMSFANYYVTDSLCCPSRSSLLRGQFPHNTGIFTNGGMDGGFGTFYTSGEEATTLGTTLQTAGYATALMGKYLNGYLQPGNPAPPGYVPPGWTEWDGIGDGYAEYNYTINRNGTQVPYGSSPTDYGVDVLSSLGQKFIGAEATAGIPFYLELSTFAPHAPYTPAPHHAGDFMDAVLPQLPSFNQLPVNPPSWLAPHAPLTETDIANLNTDFRMRLQSAAGIDDMIGAVVGKLRNLKILDNTYVIFTADNGYHLGQHRMFEGKLTAFDSDIHVPLIVRGPGVPANSHVSAMSENIDLAPTFEAIAGATAPSFTDGQSLLPILQTGQTPQGWRDAILIEHHDEGHYAQQDPDVQLDLSMHEEATPQGYTVPPDERPLTYEALRTATAVYIEYANGEGEYYDYVTDPYELNNTFGSMGADLKSQLSSELASYETCAGAACQGLH